MAAKHPINASLATNQCCTSKLSLGVLRSFPVNESQSSPPFPCHNSPQMPCGAILSTTSLPTSVALSNGLASPHQFVERAQSVLCGHNTATEQPNCHTMASASLSNFSRSPRRNQYMTTNRHRSGTLLNKPSNGFCENPSTPRLNFEVQHWLVAKEALIGCFVSMSFSRSGV